VGFSNICMLDEADKSKANKITSIALLEF
jgi:hypothetical protein